MKWKIGNTRSLCPPSSLPGLSSRKRGRADAVVLSVDDASLSVLVREHETLMGFVSRLDTTLAALGGANIDLAIAMWQRFQSHYRAAVQRSASDCAALQRHSRVFGVDGLACPDGTARLLATDSTALATLGRWRANAQLLVAVRLAQVQARSPTLVIRCTWSLVSAYADATDRILRDRGRAHIDDWRQRQGESFEIETVRVQLHERRVQIQASVRRPD